MSTKRFTAGTTVDGAQIEAWEVTPTGAGQAEQWLLFMGAVHGDEPQGVWLLKALLERWQAGSGLDRTGVVVAPCINVDGAGADRRTNANGVDLNRNLPTSDWKPEFERPGNNPGPTAASEPETIAVIGLLEKYSPRAILTIHSMKEYQLNSNGPAGEWAQALSQMCRYPVTDDIGYPCPGSFGTYAGAERKIPTITFEVDSQAPKEQVIDNLLPVVEAAAGFWDARA